MVESSSKRRARDLNPSSPACFSKKCVKLLQQCKVIRSKYVQTTCPSKVSRSQSDPDLRHIYIICDRSPGLQWKPKT